MGAPLIVINLLLSRGEERGWGKGGSGKQLRTPPDDVIRQLRCSPVVLGPDTLAALELVRRWKGRKARRPTASMAAVPALTAT